MRHPLLAVLSLAAVAATLPGQIPTLPASPQMRYVDFSSDLERPDVLVLVGTLGRCKEGKRERLADGKLGGIGASVSVSGTQFFKVPLQAPIQVRAAFVGKPPERPQLVFDAQVARLPDGKEQRQLIGGNNAAIADDLLALFVLAPKKKGKELELLHLIPFDDQWFKGANGPSTFVDAMYDFTTVNRRVHDLGKAIAALDAATVDAERKQARVALQELLDRQPDLRRSENDALLTQHVRPLEQRARKRLDDGADGGKDGKGDEDDGDTQATGCPCRPGIVGGTAA